MRVLTIQMNPTIGDLKGNSQKISQGIALGKAQGADIVLFPELALCGYPPEDLLLMPHFCQAVEDQLPLLAAATQGITAIVGTIRRKAGGEKGLYNSAAILSDGKCLGYQDKVLLPTYDVFTERRYFEPGGPMRTWEIAGRQVAVTICEDIWQHAHAVTESSYTRDPIEELRELKPDALVNLSASPFSLGRFPVRVEICRRVSKTLRCPVWLCNQVGANDSLIFDGNSFYIDGTHQLAGRARGFVEDALWVDSERPTVPLSDDTDAIADLYDALVLGVHDYFHKSGFQTACLGLSGGVDSAVVACIAAKALGADKVLGVLMPSRFSSETAMEGARQLAVNLGIQTLALPIEKPFTAYLNLLEPVFTGHAWDTTEENLQARIRGMILMALSNKFGHIVLATGNKSELAMGYATLYGDMCGGLGVINDVTKGQVYALAHEINRTAQVIPQDTLTRPPSAELRPNQLDSDSLPDYAIVDLVLQDYVEKHQAPHIIAQRHHLPLELVLDLVQRIHRNEYKRRQSPPGLRVTQRAFSAGRRFPIVLHKSFF